MSELELDYKKQPSPLAFYIDLPKGQQQLYGFYTFEPYTRTEE